MLNFIDVLRNQADELTETQLVAHYKLGKVSIQALSFNFGLKILLLIAYLDLLK